MSSKTKILVVKLKEVIYTLIFTILGILLIILLVLIALGHSKKVSETLATDDDLYAPGVYTVSLMLSANPAELEVVVDSNQIKSIRLINTQETITTMYPLITSSLESIASSVILNNSTDNVTYTESNKYTSIVLVKAIEQALEKAANKP